ncbi:hypothetical protein J4232_01955 [Candidatus Woesearchaeota archaeon]|nr:hypothetical protein [Candidatus Woesearchaeota archaeon]
MEKEPKPIVLAIATSILLYFTGASIVKSCSTGEINDATVVRKTECDIFNGISPNAGSYADYRSAIIVDGFKAPLFGPDKFIESLNIGDKVKSIEYEGQFMNSCYHITNYKP